jgi:hypothetical protein
VNTLLELEAQQIAVALSLDPAILEVFCSEIRDARHGAESEFERSFSVTVHNSQRRRQTAYEKTNLATGRCCKCSKARDSKSSRFCSYHLRQNRKYSLKWWRANHADHPAKKFPERLTVKKLAKVEVSTPEEKRGGRPTKILDTKRIAAFRAQGVGWKRIAEHLGVAPATIYRQGLPQQFERVPAGPKKKILDLRKLERIEDPVMESPLHAIESLLIFDARCLDKETRQELLRLVPQLVHIRRAWKAEYMECGCTYCHKKKAEYGAGGLCNGCRSRIYMRMRNRFRKAMEGRDLPAELATFKDALQLKYNAAQRLFNGLDE